MVAGNARPKMVPQRRMRRKTTHCLTKKVLQSDSLPQIRKYSKAAELLALHVSGKEGGDGGPINAREASDHQGDGATRGRSRPSDAIGARRDLGRSARPLSLERPVGDDHD